jgi:hypothetical protein
MPRTNVVRDDLSPVSARGNCETAPSLRAELRKDPASEICRYNPSPQMAILAGLIQSRPTQNPLLESLPKEQTSSCHNEECPETAGYSFVPLNYEIFSLSST